MTYNVSSGTLNFTHSLNEVEQMSVLLKVAIQLNTKKVVTVF